MKLTSRSSEEATTKFLKLQEDFKSKCQELFQYKIEYNGLMARFLQKESELEQAIGLNASLKSQALRLKNEKFEIEEELAKYQMATSEEG